MPGQANGNVFTYMFGPQIKKHSGKFQPFGEALFGAAHSNLYAQIYNAQTGIDLGQQQQQCLCHGIRRWS